MNPGRKIELSVLRGGGRVEPRNDLPRQFEFHVPRVPTVSDRPVSSVVQTISE